MPYFMAMLVVYEISRAISTRISQNPCGGVA